MEKQACRHVDDMHDERRGSVLDRIATEFVLLLEDDVKDHRKDGANQVERRLAQRANEVVECVEDLHQPQFLYGRSLCATGSLAGMSQIELTTNVA